MQKPKQHDPIAVNCISRLCITSDKNMIMLNYCAALVWLIKLPFFRILCFYASAVCVCVFESVCVCVCVSALMLVITFMYTIKDLYGDASVSILQTVYLKTLLCI